MSHQEDFSAYTDLARKEFGGKAVYTNDDFFASKDNLLKPGRGIFIVDKYTPRGKWMDGWESRRKRGPGHDWCIVKLGFPGIIRGFDIDTNHFTGNYPPYASVDGLLLGKNPKPLDFKNKTFPWAQLLEKSPLKGTSQNLFAIDNEMVCDYLRLNIFPDGGVARLRVYGEVKIDWAKKDKKKTYELSAVQNGGRALSCSDMHYSDRKNLLKPGRGVNMGDGWETKRKRGPGNDWVILKLGHPGVLEKIEVDTAHFKGNFPDRCSVHGLYSNHEHDSIAVNDPRWQELVPETKLKADHQHFFKKELKAHKAVSHLRLDIYPDGGVSRFRAFGRLG